MYSQCYGDHSFQSTPISASFWISVCRAKLPLPGWQLTLKQNVINVREDLKNLLVGARPNHKSVLKRWQLHLVVSKTQNEWPSTFLDEKSSESEKCNQLWYKRVACVKVPINLSMIVKSLDIEIDMYWNFPFLLPFHFLIQIRTLKFLDLEIWIIINSLFRYSLLWNSRKWHFHWHGSE